jgi:hypothetical protein
VKDGRLRYGSQERITVESSNRGIRSSEQPCEGRLLRDPPWFESVIVKGAFAATQALQEELERLRGFAGAGFTLFR